MANPLARGSGGIPVPMNGNVQKMQNAQNAMQGVMGRMQNIQSMMRGGNFNPQQMMSSMQNDPQASQGIQALREKYGMDKSATDIAKEICKENGLDFNQMASMIPMMGGNPMNGMPRR